MFNPITALDEVLALRSAGLLWVSGGGDESPQHISTNYARIDRHHQEELLAFGCKYYILLEE